MKIIKNPLFWSGTKNQVSSGSNAKVLKYRFNHKEAKYRLTEEVRFLDGVEMTQQTYKQNIEEVTWYPVSDSALLSLYKYFLDFKKND